MEEKIIRLLEPEIINLGYELYDVEYIKQGKDYYLKIYIDNKNPITLEDCETVSNAINVVLDKADYIKEQYYLEVSSPGIERVLRKDKHLDNSLGKEIEVTLYQKWNKQKQFTGILEDFNNSNIILKIKEEKIIIDRNNIAQMKQLYHWE